MGSGGTTMSAILKGKDDDKEKKRLVIDKDNALAIYKLLEELWNKVSVGASSGNISSAYGSYMTILERYKEDILDDR